MNKETTDMNKKQNIRHGDILLVPVEKAPAGTDSPDGLVLAFGEASGHAHRASKGHVIVAPGTTSFEELGGSAQAESKYILAERGTVLTHEEHGRIKLEPLTYEVIHQVEETDAGPVRVVD